MSALTADDAIQFVRGVGPRRAEQFAALGLRAVRDLLEHLPFRYEQDQGFVEIADLRPEMNATIHGRVLRIGGRYPGQTAQIDDGTGRCTLRWFQRPQGREALYIGATAVATGRVKVYNERLEMVQPALRVYRPDAAPEPAAGARLVGVYRATAELTSATIRQAIEQVYQQGAPPAEEFVPPALLARRGLPERDAALRMAHAPRTEADADLARRRLAYEEFLLLELALALRRRRLLSGEVGRVLPISPEIDRRIRVRFPFALTPSQDAVIRELVADVGSGRPMTRLLQGDVGSGKTVVALYACLLAVANRHQAAIMAPTEVLAQQHFAGIERYLHGSRVRRALLTGAMPRREREALLRGIERGGVDLVVGTQALLERDVSFASLAMIVVDEQHKFGVVQRARFRTKGPMPHYLVMTATPIPRTLAMTVFGDLDVSVIAQPPPGRGRTITRVVPARQWDAVMQYVRTRLEAGERAYIVCPRIGEDDAGGEPVADGPSADAVRARELTSVRQEYERLIAGPWQGLSLALLHGSMPPDEKKATLAAFASGKLHALVSTTVIEVGVDVPAATVMIVEHAERFGLSQLHQLRGRVGRGARDSLCVLVARGPGLGSDTRAAERLAVLAKTTDGFRIAEADLRQRGPGELLGTRQHGLPELRFGDLVADFALLEQARDDAFEIVRDDPGLAAPEHAALRPALERLLGEKLSLIDAA